MTFEELEKIRIKCRNKIIRFWILSAFILVILLLICSASGEKGAILNGVAIFFVAMFVATKIMSGASKEYTAAYKEYFVKKSLESVFTDLKYLPNKGLNRDVIANTGMLYMGDTYSSNDYVEGKYKDVGFVQADVHIQKEYETTDSHGDTTTHYVTLFKGRWMVFEFNKKFKADVQVCEKGFGSNKTGDLFSASKYEKVKMESEKFNKKFNVYAKDAHEAFYILTPSLMEKIEKLEDQNSGKILLCFVDNKLHVGLYDHTNSFEPVSCFAELSEEEIKNIVSTDVSKITMFVDELGLDNDLFKK